MYALSFEDAISLHLTSKSSALFEKSKGIEKKKQVAYIFDFNIFPILFNFFFFFSISEQK